ncbi:hypothetical protein I552_0113 [Mycobacterium xenopi 3993]|nr:hypothetical protein I552_0113 [Mycobacterium xenopi 3993]
MKWCDEHAEAQGLAHRNSKLDRKSSSTSLILSGRSCCSQCPARRS